MKIALIGYGKMGRTIEEIAISRGHEIVLKIDVSNAEDLTQENLKKADVAIEFTTPDSAVDNYRLCFSSGVPVVSGTTGWLSRKEEVEEACREQEGCFFYASNFSLGVNLFFELNRKLARMMNAFDQYNISMTEVHHIHKLDVPSGTAISLAEDIIGEVKRIDTWTIDELKSQAELPIHAIREGEVPGIHTVKYDSEVDFIEITHNAKSRRGFAFGAVLAAEFCKGRKGILSMKNLLDELA